MINNPYLPHALAIVLERIRREKQISKSALSLLADIERCYLRDILKGKRNPTINTIFSLCDALQISPADLFQQVVEETKALQKQESQE